MPIMGWCDGAYYESIGIHVPDTAPAEHLINIEILGEGEANKSLQVLIHCNIYSAYDIYIREYREFIYP